MSKLSKKDFDAFLGEDAYYTDQDKERFIKNINRKKPTKNHWFPQLLTSALLLGVLVIGVQFFKEDTSFLSSLTNPKPQAEYDFGEGVKTVDSWEEVEQYYLDRIPGLKRAENLGLVTKVDKIFTLNDDSTLHLDKIWYNSRQIEFFYSIGLPDPSLIPEYAPEPIISSIWVNRNEDVDIPKQQLGFYEEKNYPREGIIYKDRLYHYITTDHVFKEADNEYGVLEKINHVLNTDIRVSLFHDEITIPNVDIPVRYDKENETVLTTKMNKEVKDTDMSMKFNQLDIGVTDNFIYGDIHLPDEYNFSSLVASFSDDQNYQNESVYGVPNGPDEFMISIPTFNQIPEHINVNIDKIFVESNDSFEFSLDVTDYKEKQSSNSGRYEVNTHQKVGEFKDNSIYLEKLLYTSTGIVMTIQYEPLDKNQQLKLHADNPSVFFHNDSSYKQPLFISGQNEKGETALFGHPGSKSDDQFNVLIDREFITNSEVVDISVENLLYEINVDQSIEIPVSSE
ncbi:hypothetical protein GMD78_07755 [Ornithinibacillus sp. L9]|uniref:DUF4179 domain-containing protein n=1 Tax=Ornithinibacillus caprae TaxID=2678566 RepID=A0A6N8FF08_9BACI|nr:hypothetical protein [Ornithinibacillus caprae]MUK88282.1 hypothetical protein [Ornithinibacillus caprae]